MSERRHTHRWLAALAGLLGALAAAAGEPYPRGARRATEVGVLDVARWLRDGNRAVRVVDVRSHRQFAAYHIPGAEHVPQAELREREWRREQRVVLYADDARRADEASRVLGEIGVAEVHVLLGGLLAWIDSIAEPRLEPISGTAGPAEHAARREHLELSRYFGGLPLVSPSSPRATAEPAAPLPPRPLEAVARMMRRGC